MTLEEYNTFCASLPQSEHVVQWGGGPAPYLASRGMKWIQHYAAPGLDDARMKDHLVASYEMAIKRLTKKSVRSWDSK